MAILLVGASVRALAESATRAGEEVIAADLFGDQDLRSIARHVHVLPMESYPDSITSISSRYPGTARCYTGGLENRPAILQTLAADGPLWGNNAEVVRPIRDPFRLHQYLIERRLSAPAVRRFNDPPPTADGWLIKPNRGTGGTHIRLANANGASENEHYQRIEAGIPCSALFVGCVGNLHLIGVSRQVLASETSSPLRVPSPFAYVGSIGPLSSEPQRDFTLRKLGQALADDFKLRGLFGVDFLWGNKEVVIIEINPRYTASAEVFELAHQTPMFHAHRAAFTAATSSQAILSHPRGVIGKWILFAPQDGRLTQSMPTFWKRRGNLWCSDLPEVGQSFVKGEPVATILMEESSFENLPTWPTEPIEQLWKDCFTST
jgi:predicted ATP-grasp superfamily ATP-dependent carboligase